MSILKVRGLRHDAASTDAINLDSAGNVGIGTGSPAFPLDVAGAMRGNSWIGRSNVSAPTADCAMYRAADNTLAFSTANTERMRIDSSGRVTMPYQPAFSASNTNTASYETIYPDSAFPFNTTRINIGSHFSTSTYRFTAPIAGLYEFSYSLFYEAGTGASNHDACFWVNGVALLGSPSALQQMSSRPSTDRITMQHTALISLSASDYVEVRARSTLSGGVYGPHSMFCGRLVS